MAMGALVFWAWGSTSGETFRVSTKSAQRHALKMLPNIVLRSLASRDGEMGRGLALPVLLLVYRGVSSAKVSKYWSHIGGACFAGIAFFRRRRVQDFDRTGGVYAHDVSTAKA